MDEGTLGAVLAAYGITGARLLAIERGYRNRSHHVVTPEGEHLNFILYKYEPGIASRIGRANAVSGYLARHGLPARRTYRDSRVLQVSRQQYGALYEYIAGATIPWEAYTKSHLKELGRGMGAMHTALAGMPPIVTPQITSEYTALYSRIQQYFSQPAVRSALQAKLGVQVNTALLQRYARLLSVCSQLPGQQLHMDFVRGNVLFSTSHKARLAGILDFEKTAYGHPLFDIARTVAFLQADCKYKSPADIYQYFIVSGYNRHSNSTFKMGKASQTLLQNLIYLFLIYDFYKFLRHNPYESLPENEHYMRTARLLRHRPGSPFITSTQAAFPR